MPTTAELSNRLTAAWLHRLGSTDTATPDTAFVVSGAGVWSMLALLAAAASGPARAELEAVVGLDADEAASALNELLSLLAEADGLSTALGLWATPEAQLKSDFSDLFPGATVDALPQTAELDRWVSEKSGGQIDKFPIEISEETLMAGATVLAADSEWLYPLWCGPGSWVDSTEQVAWLHGSDRDLERASILRRADGEPVGRVVWPTKGTFDVHLLTGTGGAAQVLGAGLEAVDHQSAMSVTQGLELAEGDRAGGLVVGSVNDYSPLPGVKLSMPSFAIASRWDLMAKPADFGLATATDTRRGHFDRMAAYPLAMEAAAQSVTAAFSAEGFRAAAVTAFAAVGGGMPEVIPGLVVSVTLDQPFGFLVVHRSTQLALFAGWVDESASEPIPDDLYIRMPL